MTVLKDIVTTSLALLLVGGTLLGLSVVAFVQAVNISSYMVQSQPIASESVTKHVIGAPKLKVKELPFTNTAKLQSTQPASQLYNLSPGVELFPLEILHGNYVL